MKHSFFYLATIMLAAGLCTVCCRRESCDQAPVHDECNSVYYWKTVFNLDSADRAFLDRHEIGRVYMRMFDVVEDPRTSYPAWRTEPNASLKIDYDVYRLLTDSLTEMEFVPVVYITLDALKAMKDHEGVLASNIVTRVKNMCSYNEVPNVAELQLDCDWTKSTEGLFFELCDSVKADIAEAGLPWRLSSTIRLHQLSGAVPPVDNGMLMVYNTGNFNDPDAANSIIDVKDVEPYLKHLGSYPLHLDVAYPTYSWQLLFHDRKFMGLLNGLDLQDTTRFEPGARNTYTVRKDIPYGDRILRRGDRIRSEMSDYEGVMRVKDLIESRLNGRAHSNTLYHLDSKNLSTYSPDEIDKMLEAGR